MPRPVSRTTRTQTSEAPAGGWPGAVLRSTGGWMMAWLTNGTRASLRRYQRKAFSWYGA